MKSILYALLVAALPFGSVLADATEGAWIKAVEARIERSRRAQQAHRKEARTRLA